MALNDLPHPEDLAGGHGCCPDCCASCDVLRKLVVAGHLDTVVRQAPTHLWGPDWAWWADGGVNLRWLADCWDPGNRPPCEHSE